MADTFKIIYKILKYLERAMDFSELDLTPIMPEALGITRERWGAVLKMMIDNGYVEGVTCKDYVHIDTPVLDITRIKITLKGLEYLSENSMMKKCAEFAKGIIEVISQNWIAARSKDRAFIMPWRKA